MKYLYTGKNKTCRETSYDVNVSMTTAFTDAMVARLIRQVPRGRQQCITLVQEHVTEPTTLSRCSRILRVITGR